MRGGSGGFELRVGGCSPRLRIASQAPPKVQPAGARPRGFGLQSQSRRGTWHGFGEGLSAALELALAPVLFVLAGLWLDGRLGTRPWLAVVLAIFAMTGSTVSTLVKYKARAEAEDQGKPWAR